MFGSADASSEVMKMYFEGELVQGEALEKVARQRRRQYHEMTVPKSDLDSYVKDGWEEKRPYKTSVRLRKKKKVHELLEDEVWLLLWNMGFIEMNTDRNFKIQAGPLMKQIDVFARDENYVFVVECKTSHVEGMRIETKDIREVSDLRPDVIASIRKAYKSRRLRVRFIMATRGILWAREKEQLARQKGIVVCKGVELQYYNELVKHLGRAAKFQIYSVLFPKDKIPEPIEVPAICGRQGKVRYYCFVIQPEKLLQIGYVHHRRSTPEDLAGSYQRMLKKSRLKQISSFITAGGYFPNNIILNFTKKPTFRPFPKEEQAGEVLFGMLELPRQYASAWIIDGQHRLYGYADNERRETATVPVLAFHSLDVKEQAKLFVEINKEQKAVRPDLLWDLYPDIYHDSDEPEHKLLRTISLIVRKLNSDDDSPLRDHISIPGVAPKDREVANLTMTTLCDALRESNLVNPEWDLLFKTDYNTTVDFAGERCKAYFDAVAHAFREDWDAGRDGLLRTNIGVRILIIMLRQVLKYLRFSGQPEISQKKDLTEFRAEVKRLLNPMLTWLRDNPAERVAIREQSTKGLVLENARKLAWEIKDVHEGFGRELLRDWAPPVPEGVGDDYIRWLLEDTEKRLRSFTAKELEGLYGQAWWRQSVPAGVKKTVNQKIRKAIREAPYRRDELRALPPDRKMNYTDTPHLREIILSKRNWERFKHLFIEDKETTSVQFRWFEKVRHKYAHNAEDELDEITKNLGYWAMKWIRKHRKWRDRKPRRPRT